MKKTQLIPKIIVTLGLILLTIGFLWVLKTIMMTPKKNITYQVNWETISPTKARLSNGYQHYLQSCKKCHGVFGQGTYKAPSLIDDEWLHGSSIQDIYKIINNGSPNKRMYGWKNKLQQDDIIDITLYVKELKNKKNK